MPRFATKKMMLEQLGGPTDEGMPVLIPVDCVKKPSAPNDLMFI
jgi:hypothetical protein